MSDLWLIAGIVLVLTGFKASFRAGQTFCRAKYRVRINSVGYYIAANILCGVGGEMIGQWIEYAT